MNYWCFSNTYFFLFQGDRTRQQCYSCWLTRFIYLLIHQRQTNTIVVLRTRRKSDLSKVQETFREILFYVLRYSVCWRKFDQATILIFVKPDLAVFSLSQHFCWLLIQYDVQYWGIECHSNSICWFYTPSMLAMWYVRIVHALFHNKLRFLE